MLRGNLSTRPFYNERAVHLVLGLATLVVAVLTFVSATRFLSLSARQSELSAQIAVDEQRAAALRRDAAEVRRGIDQQELTTIVAATREVNRAIDERVFSWTALFNSIEQTIPADVMLSAVFPSIDDAGDVRVRLVVNADRTADVGDFMDALERAGSFADLQSIEEVRLDDGSLVVTFEGRYTMAGSPPASEATAAAEAGR